MNKELNMLAETLGKYFGGLVGLIVGVAVTACLFGLWGKWVLESIFLNDFNYWLVSLSCAMLMWAIPAQLKGIVTLALVLGTIYIWFFI